MTTAILDAIATRVIGRRRETEIVVAAVSGGCNLVLEGPPGTGKSTLLRAVAETLGRALVFVEGNAELTPARLLGAHDPALVLERGYGPDTFTDGPLVAALRDGALLYLEELNRIPEETLNVLVTAMAEREVHVPRVGRVVAADGFTVVAAMNPFDAVGTARISSAISDRANRVVMPYQDEHDEQGIVERVTGPGELVRPAVALVRATRSSPDIRVGSSVRGAIDLVRIATQLANLRDAPVTDRDVTLDASLTALTGRVRLHEAATRTAEDVITDLWRRVFGGTSTEPPSPPGKGEGRRPTASGRAAT